MSPRQIRRRLVAIRPAMARAMTLSGSRCWGVAARPLPWRAQLRPHRRLYPVIRQANGLSKCRSHEALEHRSSFEKSAASATPKRIRWIARTQNLAELRWCEGGASNLFAPRKSRCLSSTKGHSLQDLSRISLSALVASLAEADCRFAATSRRQGNRLTPGRALKMTRHSLLPRRHFPAS